MFTIKEVKTKKDIKKFINFPLELYKDCPYYVPNLYKDEYKLFTKNNPYIKTCDYKFYICINENNQVVGRIGVIIQHAYNQKKNELRARFTRFHSINNQEVANLLLDKAYEYAKEKKMNIICGPLGFSDLEREGLLVEGFEYLSTFEEEYNYPYYQTLIENYGFQEEVAWLEHRLFKNENVDKRLQIVADKLLKKYKLHIPNCKNIKQFTKRYKDKLFSLLDETYKDLYQTVPFTEEMKDSIITSFKLITDIKHTNVIVDENDNVVCFGVSFPSLSNAMIKCKGHLNLKGLITTLKSIKHPTSYDLGLVGVKKEYEKTGVTACLFLKINDMLVEENVEYVETNLNLEYNKDILNCWKRFNHIQHKKRKAYIKYIK